MANRGKSPTLMTFKKGRLEPNHSNPWQNIRRSTRKAMAYLGPMRNFESSPKFWISYSSDRISFRPWNTQSLQSFKKNVNLSFEFQPFNICCFLRRAVWTKLFCPNDAFLWRLHLLPTNQTSSRHATIPEPCLELFSSFFRRYHGGRDWLKPSCVWKLCPINISNSK